MCCYFDYFTIYEQKRRGRFYCVFLLNSSFFSMHEYINFAKEWRDFSSLTNRCKKAVPSIECVRKCYISVIILNVSHVLTSIHIPYIEGKEGIEFSACCMFQSQHDVFCIRQQFLSLLFSLCARQNELLYKNSSFNAVNVFCLKWVSTYI